MLSLKLNPTPRLKLSILPYLKSKLIQTLRILQMSPMALLSEIDTVVLNNPVIEVVREGTWEGDWNDLEDFVRDAPGHVFESLKLQLDLLELDDVGKNIGVALIEALDDRGFLTQYSAIQQEICRRLGVAPHRVDDILVLIQTFDPEGIASRSLQDCFLIQIEHYEFKNTQIRDLLRVLVTNHLQDIEDQKWDSIAQTLKITVEGVHGLIEFIKHHLSASPIMSVSQKIGGLMPSFEVKIGDDLQVKIINLEEKNNPKLGISQYYKNLLLDPTVDKKSKKYIQNQLQKAQEWLQNVKVRQMRLDSLICRIVHKQDQFFYYGPDYLVPFLQKELGKELGIKPCVVSRLLTNKAIQTPFGIFPLKVLCPRDHFGSTETKLKKVIQNYCQNHPQLSDIEVQAWLKTKGVRMARRTVNHYRRAG